MINSQLTRSRNGDGAYSIDMGRCPTYYEQWSYAAEEMCPTGVGSGDTSPFIAAHTSGDTSQSTLRNFSVAFHLQHQVFLL